MWYLIMYTIVSVQPDTTGTETRKKKTEKEVMLSKILKLVSVNVD